MPYDDVVQTLKVTANQRIKKTVSKAVQEKNKKIQEAQVAVEEYKRKYKDLKRKSMTT